MRPVAIGRLEQRTEVTTGALAFAFVGTFGPVPGVDGELFARWHQRYATGLTQFENVVTAGGLARFSVLWLGLLPFLNAAVLLYIIGVGLDLLRGRGARSIRQQFMAGPHLIWLTALIATGQGLGVASVLEGVRLGPDEVVAEPGQSFRLTVAFTLATGSVLVVWIADVISAMGWGYGLLVVLAASVAAGLVGLALQ